MTDLVSYLRSLGYDAVHLRDDQMIEKAKL